ncbi:uncharacterized protein [Ptychodera flava]|uniref:uncharacterized protein n=1 Tax=Ptychodera flava TaxID=63121 RepID=UPI00396A35A5
MRVVLSLLVSAFLVGDPYECFAQEITVTSTSITNAGSVTYTAGGVAQTISITLGLTDTDGGGGTGAGNTISKISVYFTDNGEYESSTPASTSTAIEKTYTPAKAVTADVWDDKTIIAGETVDLLIDVANCEAYTHVCVVITTGTANIVQMMMAACRLVPLPRMQEARFAQHPVFSQQVSRPQLQQHIL